MRKFILDFDSLTPIERDEVIQLITDAGVDTNKSSFLTESDVQLVMNTCIENRIRFEYIPMTRLSSKLVILKLR